MVRYYPVAYHNNTSTAKYLVNSRPLMMCLFLIPVFSSTHSTSPSSSDTTVNSGAQRRPPAADTLTSPRPSQRTGALPDSSAARHNGAAISASAPGPVPAPRSRLSTADELQPQTGQQWLPSPLRLLGVPPHHGGVFETPTGPVGRPLSPPYYNGQRNNVDSPDFIGGMPRPGFQNG